MRRSFLNIYQNFSYFPLIGPQKGPALLSEQSKSPSPKNVSYQVWLKLAYWFLRRWFYKHFPIYHYVKVKAPGAGPNMYMTLGTLFEQNWILSSKGSFVPNINAFRPVVHEKKIFEYLSKFSLFCPLFGPKRGQPLYLNNLNPHSPSMFPIKFGWNWLIGSWEEDFLCISLKIIM